MAPLSVERPKALCPVGGVALVDRALAALARVTSLRAVNAHHGAAALAGHVYRHHGEEVHVAHEDLLLGTGGALGALRPWIDGRPVMLVNADTVHGADLGQLTAGWDGERIRALLAEPAGTVFGPGVRLCGVLMPWAAVAGLPPAPASVYERVWAPWAAAGRVETLTYDGPWFDCGTPATYLAANLWVSGGQPVVGDGADVLGSVERTVVWDGATVWPRERLVDAVRTTEGRTVLVRARQAVAAPPMSPP